MLTFIKCHYVIAGMRGSFVTQESYGVKFAFARIVVTLNVKRFFLSEFRGRGGGSGRGRRSPTQIYWMGPMRITLLI